MPNDFISREAVLKFIADIEECKYEPDKIFLYCQHLRRIPAADVVPVVHGRWVWDGLDWAWKCSLCATIWKGIQNPKRSPNDKHCSECGALMDGGDPK